MSRENCMVLTESRRTEGTVSKEIGSEQTPKSTIAALGKMPGSEGNHGQTAKHRRNRMPKDVKSLLVLSAAEVIANIILSLFMSRSFA